MKRVVVDASALAALAFDEPAADDVARRLQGAAVYAPALLKYEMANVAWKKARRQPDSARSIFSALAAALNPRRGIMWREVDPVDAALLSVASGLTSYDASYVWLAGILGADLVTLDERLIAALDSDTHA